VRDVTRLAGEWGYDGTNHPCIIRTKSVIRGIMLQPDSGLLCWGWCYDRIMRGTPAGMGIMVCSLMGRGGRVYPCYP
jgi:hypothetical protein